MRTTTIITLLTLCLSTVPADALSGAVGKAQLKCETTTGKALSTLAVVHASCTRTCLAAGRKRSHTYTGCFAPLAGAAQVCIHDPEKGAVAKARRAVAKACSALPGSDACPACYPTTTCATGDPFVADANAYLAALAPDVHCVESGSRAPAVAAPPATPTKREAKCEDGLSKALGKLVGATTKCYAACNARSFRGKITPESCQPPSPGDAKTRACLDKARNTAVGAVDKACFRGRALAPSCYDGSALRPTSALGWVTRIETVLHARAAAITCLLPCGNGITDLGEACDPPGSIAQCAGRATCSSSCQCPTTLTDSAGIGTNTIQSASSVAGSVADLAPYGQYDLRVRRHDGTEVAYLRLTADGSGTIPLTILAYNLAAGTYTVEVRGIATSVGNVELTFVVSDVVAKPQGLPSDAGGTLRTSYDPGEDVYLSGRGFIPSTQVDLYVVTDQAAWVGGDVLIDRSGTIPATEPDPGLPRARDAVEFSGTADTVTVAADGTIPPTRLWESVEGVGGVFDVVVDVDRNGIFDPAVDAVTDHLTTGFVIQVSSAPALGRAIGDDLLANLSHDRSCRTRDQYTPADDVRVLINPTVRMQLGGDRTVKKYIVAHQLTWTAGDPLVDVSGANSPWDADTVQTGCTNEGCVLTWPAPLTAGEYDVVIDVNRNDHYDPGVDILDGGICPGFIVSDRTPARKDWTVMVYMDGDNDLEGPAIEDLNEMEMVGSSDRVNVVVQLDRIPNHDASNGDWTETRRYFVTHDTDPELIGSQQLTCPSSEVNMADPLVLQDFLSWGAANYPADNYALVIWNHGRGFRLRETRRARITRDIAWDDTNGGALDMPEVEHAIRASGVSLSLLGYDACLMGMVEVAEQTAALADVTTFSQDLEPGDGWPYHTILADLVAAPATDAVGFGRTIVQRYREEFASGSGITYSSVPQAGLVPLVDAMDAFATAMIDGMDAARDTLLDARVSAQGFDGGSPDYDDYRDLHHFASLVLQGVTGADPASTAIRVAAQGVVDAVVAAVDAEQHSADVPNAHGLTAWLPDCAFFNNHVRKYGDLRFARNTRWDDFLATLCGQLVRVELTWGAQPSDLDSHLWDAETVPNHLYYSRKTIPSADLDLDDTTGFGPENVRITPIVGPRNRYDYAVHHFGGSLPPSGPITVRVFRASATVPVATFTRTTWPISRGYWHVFSLDPATATVTTIDAMVASAPFAGRAREEDAAVKK